MGGNDRGDDRIMPKGKTFRGVGGVRAHSPEAERRYRTIRGWQSDMGYWLNVAQEEILKTHLHEDYRNPRETEASLMLSGYIDALRKNMIWHATRKDMQRFFMLAEKMRWDKGYGLSKRDAVASWFSGDNPKAIKLGARPKSMWAKDSTPYTPRHGSSLGKLATKQIGAVRVQKDFKRAMEAIFTILDGIAKFPTVKITRRE